MSWEPINLFVSMIFGAFGLGYFIYGKKQGKFFSLLSGIALMVFPYFVSNLWMMVAIGLGLISLPFIASRF